MSTTSSPVLSARGWSKTFGGSRALDHVDLDIDAGEVHALLGQNGSGKSTFIKILAGFHTPDPGASLTIHGRDVPLPMKHDSILKNNLAFVHQDLGLVDELNIVENIRVGRFSTGLGCRIKWNDERAEVAQLLQRFGLTRSPATMVRELTEVERATLAIIRAVDQLSQAERPGVLVLDEPTAYLPRDSVGVLFDVIRQVTGIGFGVLFVTHRLDEVRQIADTTTVLRDGRAVAHEVVAELTEDQLIEHIVGFEIDQLYPDQVDRPLPSHLGVTDLSGEVLRGVSFELRSGEILGLTGLIGTGWDEVPYLVSGAKNARTGSLTTTIATPRHRVDLTRTSVRKMLRHGVALLPANRLRDAAVGDATVAENLTLPTLRRHFSGLRLSPAKEFRHVKKLIERFDVRPSDPDRLLGTLSGGNQQKVVIAKWLESDPSIFIMHEPTQGVDIGSRQQIFEVMRASADAGTSIMLVSAEYQDLAHMCDRVLIFQDGCIVAELAGASLTEQRIAAECLRDRPVEGLSA
jgi:ribose transport system ATP-binding protein